MIDEVQLSGGPSLDDYAEDIRLTGAVSDLKAEARQLRQKLDGRRVWMVNSTAQGGGVAEMLPRLVSLLGDLGIETRWLVMGTKQKAFFSLTKRLHNLIHGSGDPQLSAEDERLYDEVSREVAADLEPRLRKGDILVCHDPQPAGACARVAKQLSLPSVWRSHIGLDEDLPQTRAAWRFLEATVKSYDHAVFSAPEYIPDYLSGNVSIIFPALDPFSHKNRPLSIHKLSGILSNAALVPDGPPVVTEAFDHPVMRLRGDGTFGRAVNGEDLGLLFRPIVTQISRWDRLKGWTPLLEAFAELKLRAKAGRSELSSRQARTLSLVRLVLGGPEPSAVKDDPEAIGVLDELTEAYRQLPTEVQKDVALLSLPMASLKQNALIVNALQRCSTVVVQNSLREGFGLTVAEAMWKRAAVLGSNACGIRHQIRSGIDGELHHHPDSPDSLSLALESLLIDPGRRAQYGARGQRRVFDEFLVFAQTAKWLRVLARTADQHKSA
jgi:trehalose synthase